MSDALQLPEPQQARPPHLSPTPRVYPKSCPLSWCCHPTISSYTIPFSSCPQSFLASGSFPMSQRFTSGGHSIGTSTSASVLPMNTRDWFPLGWTGWISLLSKGLSRVFSNTTVNPLLLNWSLWCDGRGSGLEYSITIWLIISLLVALSLLVTWWVFLSLLPLYNFVSLTPYSFSWLQYY